MRLFTKAAGVAISATALIATVAPAANAAPGARLTVCVSGLHGHEADVEINRVGPGGRYDGEADRCDTFYGLRSGLYLVEIDPPWGFRADDDDRWVRLSKGERETVWFDVDRRWNRHHDDDHDHDHDHGDHWNHHGGGFGGGGFGGGFFGFGN